MDMVDNFEDLNYGLIKTKKIMKATMKFNLEEGSLIIGEYVIKNNLSRKSIEKSNLKELLLKQRNVEGNYLDESEHVYLKTIEDGKYYMAVTLEFKKDKLNKIYLNKVNPKFPLQNEERLKRIHRKENDSYDNDFREYLDYFFVNNKDSYRYDLIDFSLGEAKYTSIKTKDSKKYMLSITFKENVVI